MLARTNDNSELDNDKKLDKLMTQNYAYTDPSDPDLQYINYKKREFYAHHIPPRPDITNYNDIKEYRENICARDFMLHEHQAMLSNYINPDTPYRGILIFHGLGTGKCVWKNAKCRINGMTYNMETIWNTFSGYVYSDKNIDTFGDWSVPTETLYVDSYHNNSMIKQKVKHLFREYINSHIKMITFNDGSKIGTTFAHKFLGTQGWTNNYDVGDIIAIFNNNVISWTQIMSIDIIPYNDYVYDLEIESTHNYVVDNIICHNTCAGIAVAEKFKTMVQKYNTKIYILVSGPLIKENWKRELLKCTGETYLKYQDKSVYIDPAEQAKLQKTAMAQVLQYYKFMSYRSFYKRVLGEKIVDKKVIKGAKVRVSYRKNEEGDFERDIAVDRIYNLNNSIILIDEAHNLTGNAYGDALMHVIKNSINLRIVLLTGTPMKNLADDIVPLLNFIRPHDSPIERDKIFDSNHNHLMDFKEGGIEYLKNMASGYVSHVRGADPLTFATRVDKGEVPPGLSFIKVIRCKMLPFQKKIYDIALLNREDTLDRKSEAVANFVFPGLADNKKELIGLFGREGINSIKTQIKNNSELLNKLIATDILGIKDEIHDLLYVSDDGKSVTGKILQFKYLKSFSTKFYKALKKINRLVWGKKGPRVAFVYSNLVKVGIELFQQILLQNGWLEYQDKTTYKISPNTVCYFCGKTYAEHINTQNRLINTNQTESDTESDTASDIDSDTDSDTDSESNEETKRKIQTGGKKITGSPSDVDDISDSSSDYEKPKKTEIPQHKFYPATFISITGKSNEESAEFIPEDKKRILDDIYNSLDNKDGKYIKLVLGSKVMNEGISLKNVAEVHILDVYFNLGKVDQVVGRGIRNCSHHKLMSEINVFPKVNVYKYVVTIDDGLSTEEELYKKAEEKYLLIKKVERAIKEIAIDCPLNLHGNMFKEEIEKYKKCNDPGEEQCPNVCDYQKCEYMCDNKKLNAEYYDPERKIYKKINKNDLDYSTFTQGLAKDEIEYAKKKIKEMYITNYVYDLPTIIDYVKNSYDDDKKDLFDEFFVYKGLDELIPITENDFISFKDTILDKFGRQGYLKYIGSYYIFQHIDHNDDEPMYYRTTFDKQINQKIGLYNYLKNSSQYQKLKGLKSKIYYDDDDNLDAKDSESLVYNFDKTMEYYDNRDEFEFVGIIDKENNKKKNKPSEENYDIFKIREKRPKILDKKRGTGIPSLKGAVCSTSKHRTYLEKVAKKLGIEKLNDDTRTNICDQIKEKMLLLEKYNKDNLTYIMIPYNHKSYPFPYNIYDRKNTILDKLMDEIKIKLDITIDTVKKISGNEKGYPSINIIIKDDKKLVEYESILNKYNAVKAKGNWLIKIE